MYGFLISHIGGTEFLSVLIKMINAEEADLSYSVYHILGT